MKRTRSIGNAVQGKAIVAGGDNADASRDEEPPVAPVPALPVLDPPGVRTVTLPPNLTPETLAMVAATEPLVRGVDGFHTYTPIPPSPFPPALDHLDVVRTMLLNSVKSSNIAVGWCARWPRVATVSVILHFSEDLINFFNVPQNAQNVFQDPGRRVLFSNSLAALHLIINTHMADFNEYMSASIAAADYKMNKVAALLEQRQLAILLHNDAVPPCSPSLQQDITAYFTQTGAVFVRLARVMSRMEKIVGELHATFLHLRNLMLNEVPQQVRELLWPQQ